MDMKLIAIVVVVAIVAVVGVAAFLMMGGGGSGIKDCGSDMTCFAQSAGNCSPVKVVYTVAGVTELVELRGMANGNCNMYMKITSSQLPGGSADLTCSAPLQTFAELSNSETSYTALGTMMPYCTGSLKDLYTSAMNSGAVPQ